MPVGATVQLLDVIKETPAKRTMIFCNTVGGATALMAFLTERNLPVVCLHSDVPSSVRGRLAPIRPSARPVPWSA